MSNANSNTNRANTGSVGGPRPGGGPRMGHGPGGMMMPGEKPKKIKETLLRLWKYMKNHKALILCVVICVVASAVAQLFPTRLIGIAIDKYILKSDFNGLLKLCGLIAAIYIVSVVTSWLQMMLSITVSQNVVTEIRKDIFDKFQVLPLKFFDSKTHGELMSRVTNDVDNISGMLNMGISQIISSSISFTGTLVFMLMLSPVLTVVSIIVIPIILLTTKLITKRSRTFFKKQQTVLGNMNGLIEESISGQKVVKIFVKEKDQIAAFQQHNEELCKVGVDAQIYSGAMGPVMNVFNNFSYALVAAAGGALALAGSISKGDIASFLIYSKQFGRPLNEIANQYNTIMSGIAGAERVFDILDQQPEPEDAPGAVELKNIKGKVELKNVDFRYTDDKPVLRDVSLTAEPGQVIALVGPTGAGKTTVINLLTRFYDIQKGEIKIDGINIQNIQRNSLRSSLGIVLQDTYLFTGTIKENIRYGRMNATDEEITRASILANAHEFIRRLPHGYDTELTEAADNLSQGQKQMIAIARAILADPAILILDEATSSVDTRTELKIQHAMLNLMNGRTNFVIAHRLSTIRNADLIAVIRDGQIVERGNHDELIKLEGFYHKLYNSQFDVEDEVV